VLHLVADAPPPSWVRIDVRCSVRVPWTMLTYRQNPRSVQKVVVILVPGLTPALLSLPPLPTSATANPNLPLPIPYPPQPTDPFPFLASKFSHACPTKAPGEQTKMYSVLTAFFQTPVTGEEKKRKLQERLTCKSILSRTAAFLTVSLCSRTHLGQESTPLRAFVGANAGERLSYPLLHGRCFPKAAWLDRDPQCVFWRYSESVRNRL
jgi:RNA exonuclease 1